MENNTQSAAQAAEVPTFNPPAWDYVGGQTDKIVTAPTTTTPEVDPQTKDTVNETVVDAPAEVKEEIKPEPVKAEEVKVEAPAEEKPEELTLELKAEDIKDAPKLFKEGSVQAIAQDLGITLEKDSIEDFQKAFKENFILKAEAEKYKEVGKEQLYSQLNPKTAAVLEMIELGVPEEMAFNPTAGIDSYLALDDAQLLREELSAQPGWTEDMVDTQMEEFAADPSKLAAKAKIIRVNLNNQKQEILNTQSQLVQKYTEQKKQAELQQKVEADNQFKEALNNESTFMGLALSKEAKEVILKKYNSGAYENLFNVAQSKLKAILQAEFGDKFAKTVQSKAKEEGKAEIVKKLADVPPTKSGGGRVVNAPVETNKDSPFANMPSMWG